MVPGMQCIPSTALPLLGTEPAPEPFPPNASDLVGDYFFYSENHSNAWIKFLCPEPPPNHVPLLAWH